ncbi:hypothetical protein H0H93_001927 [Arthromyces matolae]|nr:hypothetical protein H0H93_001927 [Arthromyces matolae]
MPKQFITVYLGVILEPSSTGTTDTKSRIISDVVLAITFLITIAAMWYIYHLMGKVKPQVIYERRKARQGKLARAASTTHSASSHSSDELPLTLAVHAPSLHQSSEDDSYRQTHTDTGYLYAPQPRHKQRLPPPRAPDDVEYGYSYDHGPGRVSTDDVGWDMGATPMRHEGMGREVGGLGAAGYGYPGQSHPQAGESSETLTGRSSSETVTLDGSRPGATSHPRTGEEREFGRGMGHTVEATDASYRTAREGSEDDHDEFAYGGYMTPPRATTTHQRSQLQPPPPQQQPLHNPFDPPNSRPAGAGASSPPPPSYRTNLNG